jgi:hypothetical protein
MSAAVSLAFAAAAGAAALAIGDPLATTSTPTARDLEAAAAPSPIPKRIRWFTGSGGGFVSPVFNDFLARNTNIVDGLFVSIARLNTSGYLSTWWDSVDAPHDHEYITVRECDGSPGQRWTLSDPDPGYVKTAASPAHGKGSRCLTRYNCRGPLAFYTCINKVDNPNIGGCAGKANFQFFEWDWTPLNTTAGAGWSLVKSERDGSCWVAGGTAHDGSPTTDVLPCNASDPNQWWKHGAGGTIANHGAGGNGSGGGGSGGCLTDLLVPDATWPALRAKMLNQYAKLHAEGKSLILSLNGASPFPPAAFYRREALAEEVLNVVLEQNLSGINVDWECCSGDAVSNTTASVAQFAATWDSVAKRLHEHNKIIGIDFGDGSINSSIPNMTEPNYMTDWSYPYYIPFMDYLTDMSTYANYGFPVDAIPCTGPDARDLNHWCRLEGLILDQLENGVDPASGQLSPGLSFDECLPAGTDRFGKRGGPSRGLVNGERERKTPTMSFITTSYSSWSLCLACNVIACCISLAHANWMDPGAAAQIPGLLRSEGDPVD